IGDSHHYQIMSDPDGKFMLTGDQLRLNGTVNYEAAQQHQVVIRVTDSHGLSRDQTFTVQVTDVNEAPGAISDSNASANSVVDDVANGAIVGLTAHAVDPDVGDSVTYSLIDNAGGRFAINATTGVVTVLDASLLDNGVASSHTVTIRATDGHGLTRDQNF